LPAYQIAFVPHLRCPAGRDIEGAQLRRRMATTRITTACPYWHRGRRRASPGGRRVTARHSLRCSICVLPAAHARLCRSRIFLMC